jgi:hypothetical protein
MGIIISKTNGYSAKPKTHNSITTGPTPLQMIFKISKNIGAKTL